MQKRSLLLLPSLTEKAPKLYYNCSFMFLLTGLLQPVTVFCICSQMCLQSPHGFWSCIASTRIIFKWRRHDCVCHVESVFPGFLTHYRYIYNDYTRKAVIEWVCNLCIRISDRKLLFKGCEAVVCCLRILFGPYQALKFLEEFLGNGWKTGYLCMFSLPDGGLYSDRLLCLVYAFLWSAEYQESFWLSNEF